MTGTISRRARIGHATILAIALVLAGGALAWASIPDSIGMVHACYTSNGTLRVVDSDAGQACKSNEKSLEWSAVKRTAYEGLGAGHVTGPNTVVVAADVTLPPGSYALMAVIEIINTGPANVQIACFLRAESAGGTHNITLVQQTVGPASGNAATFATLTATGVLQFTLGGVARMDCEDQLNNGSPTALQGTIVATSVDETTFQP